MPSSLAESHEIVKRVYLHVADDRDRLQFRVAIRAINPCYPLAKELAAKFSAIITENKQVNVAFIMKFKNLTMSPQMSGFPAVMLGCQRARLGLIASLRGIFSQDGSSNERDPRTFTNILLLAQQCLTPVERLCALLPFACHSDRVIQFISAFVEPRDIVRDPFNMVPDLFSKYDFFVKMNDILTGDAQRELLDVFKAFIRHDYTHVFERLCKGYHSQTNSNALQAFVGDPLVYAQECGSLGCFLLFLDVFRSETAHSLLNLDAYAESKLVLLSQNSISFDVVPHIVCTRNAAAFRMLLMNPSMNRSHQWLWREFESKQSKWTGIETTEDDLRFFVENGYSIHLATLTAISRLWAGIFANLLELLTPTRLQYVELIDRVVDSGSAELFRVFRRHARQPDGTND